MRTRWSDPETDEAKQVTSPVSLVVSAFASLPDVRGTLTPQIAQDSVLVLVDLGAGRDRLGGSILAQTRGEFGGAVPDLDDPARLVALVDAVNSLRAEGLLTAYHDRSDGGLWAAAVEMALAGGVGVDLDVASVPGLFAEELGAVLGGVVRGGGGVGGRLGGGRILVGCGVAGARGERRPPATRGAGGARAPACAGPRRTRVSCCSCGFRPRA